MQPCRLISIYYLAEAELLIIIVDPDTRGIRTDLKRPTTTDTIMQYDYEINNCTDEEVKTFDAFCVFPVVVF